MTQESSPPAESSVYPEFGSDTPKFKEGLDHLRQRLPEVDDNYQAIAQTGEEIIGKYQIDERLFEDEARSLIFTAIALRFANCPPTGTSQDGDNERSYAEFLLSTLAFNFSPSFPRMAAQDAEQRRTENPEVLKEIYDRYTDPELTWQLKSALAGELIAETKQRMGIGAETEFDVRVLSIATDTAQTFGLEPRVIRPDDEDSPDDPEEKKQVEIETSDDYRAYLKWSRQLSERWQEFKHLIRADMKRPHAWVTHDLGDKPTICVPMPIAEKMLSPELVGHSKYFKQEDLDADRQVIAHEFVHTQGGFLLDNLVYFGLNLEELRAEHFSGGTRSYLDVKGFFLDLSTIIGESVEDEFDKYEKGGSMAGIYAWLAQRIGLPAMLDVICLPPLAYRTDKIQESGLPGVVNISQVEALGDYNGVLKRIYDKWPDKAGIGERISQRAKRMLGGDRDFLPWNLKYRREEMHLGLITDLIEEEMKRLEPGLDLTTQQ